MQAMLLNNCYSYYVYFHCKKVPKFLHEEKLKIKYVNKLLNSWLI